MLLRFGVENHRSIKNYQQLLLTASAFKERSETLLQTDDPKVLVVPVMALYGANAAGKSTVIDAMCHMRNAILHSHSRGSASAGTSFHPFSLDERSKARPSRYDVDFDLDGIRYHYGFTLDASKICEEWLFATPLHKSRKTRQTWLHRMSDDTSIYFGKELKGENKLIEKIVRKNSLFLSAAAQNAHPQLSKIHEYFQNKFLAKASTADGISMGVAVARFFDKNPHLESKAIDFLRTADTGIAGIRYEVPPVYEKMKKFLPDFDEMMERHGIFFLTDDERSVEDDLRSAALMHKGEADRDYEVSLQNESAGTLALLSVIGPILKLLAAGGALLVDELSNALHPLMSRKIVELFSDPRINVGKAQLIFSTHDTNLLSDGLFRRDQIWFAEKDREGSTHLFPLTDIEVDKRDNLEKGYLQGRFGAVPFFGDIDEQWTAAEDVKARNAGGQG